MLHNVCSRVYYKVIKKTPKVCEKCTALSGNKVGNVI